MLLSLVSYFRIYFIPIVTLRCVKLHKWEINFIIPLLVQYISFLDTKMKMYIKQQWKKTFFQIKAAVFYSFNPYFYKLFDSRAVPRFWRQTLATPSLDLVEIGEVKTRRQDIHTWFNSVVFTNFLLSLSYCKNMRFLLNKALPKPRPFVRVGIRLDDLDYIDAWNTHVILCSKIIHFSNRFWVWRITKSHEITHFC